MHKKFTLGTLITAGLSALILLSCSPVSTNSRSITKNLQSEDPAVRIAALKTAADREDTQVLALIIDRLGDTEPDVRFFAGIALKKIAGADTFKEMGWVFYDSPANREKAVQRWRHWLKQRRSSLKTFGDARIRIENSSN